MTAARLRWGVLGLLVVVIVGSLGYLGARVADDGTGSGWHRVSSAFSSEDELQPEREAIMSQARQFVLRLNTYGPDMLDASGKELTDYRTRVDEVITPKYRTDFEKSGLPLAQATVVQLGVKRTCEVYATGVAALDTGSGSGSGTATALVAGAFTNAYPTQQKGAQKGAQGEYTAANPQPFRFEVRLVETGGKWLVDSFVPASQAGTSPTTDPSTSPSAGASADPSGVAQ